MRTEIVHRKRVRKRLCVSVFGVNSRFIFQHFESILAFCFFLIVISDSDSLYWTLYRNMVLNRFSRIFKKCLRSVNNFRTEHLGLYFLFFLSPTSEWAPRVSTYINMWVYKNYKIWIMEFVYIIRLCFSNILELSKFSILSFFSNRFWCCWCILYYKLIFCVFEHIS